MNDDEEEYKTKIQADLIDYMENGNKKRKNKVAHKILGRGSFGVVAELKTKTWPFPVAVKFQRCDDAYEIEKTYLQKMSKLAKKYSFFGKNYDSFSIKNKCCLVLPRAAGALSALNNRTLSKYIISISQQCIAAIHAFHTNFRSMHCDTHISNFFYFKEPFVETRYEDFILRPAPVRVALFDPGIVEPIKNEDGPLRGCKSEMYDYYRLFSSRSGLRRKLPKNRLLKNLRATFSEVKHDKKRPLKDWNLYFPKKTYDEVFTTLMSLMQEK